MSDNKCSALFAGIIGFVLGALAVKLAARFCPFCRTDCCCDQGGCCGGEAECCCGEGGECCGGEEGGSEECCCCDEADTPSSEAEAPAE